MLKFCNCVAASGIGLCGWKNEFNQLKSTYPRTGVLNPQAVTYHYCRPWAVWNWATEAVGERTRMCALLLVQAAGECMRACSISVSGAHVPATCANGAACARSCQPLTRNHPSLLPQPVCKDRTVGELCPGSYVSWSGKKLKMKKVWKFL